MKALAFMLLSVACGSAADPAQAASAPPPGVVLMVDDLPIRAEEIEPLARDIRLLYPEYTERHARRLALTNEILPRVAARARNPATWQAALDACRNAESRLDQETAWSGEGNWKALGLGLWSAARAQPLERWSEPIELPGRWVRVRLHERAPGAEPAQEMLRLSVLEFPYLDPVSGASQIEEAIDASRLTLLDPSWSEAVPEFWKHRMRGP